MHCLLCTAATCLHCIGSEEEACQSVTVGRSGQVRSGQVRCTAENVFIFVYLLTIEKLLAMAAGVLT